MTYRMNGNTTQSKRRTDIHAWVNLEKPLGMTSTQAVAKVKRILNVKKAGHAGTLDPLATGILPIAIGEATKTVSFLQDREKSYEFEITWGEFRDTDDGEGNVIKTSDHRPNVTDIEKSLPLFMGLIEQVPPKYSAIKINGERAYDLARDGVEFEIKSRQVQVYELALIESHENTARFRMVCGKGTYVRSLARDLSLHLGTCGYISELRRLFVGPMHEDDAISFDKLSEIVDNECALEALLPITTALDDIPALPLSDQEASRLRNGQKLIFSSRPDIERLNNHGVDHLTAEDLIVAAVNNNGEPLGLIRINGVSAKPERLFNL
jgi:tRNA pseudouridine55 synthase